MTFILKCPVRSIMVIIMSWLVFLVYGCVQSDRKLKFTSEYQAVFPDNGQVFFGKIENTGSAYPLLKDVFYVQTQVDPETKQPRSILIKRGSEWHKPDRMYVNAKHIVVIEPIGSRLESSAIDQGSEDSRAVNGQIVKATESRSQ